MSGEQNFLTRRRAGVAAEAQAEEAALEAQSLAAEHEALDEKSDEELLAHFDLPDPDTLKVGDDFSGFMSKAIPDRLRRRALRMLWRSNPVLANVDMLVDYGEDFTDKATVVENIQTAYQVGKGMLKHVEEMARQAAEKEAAEAAGDEETPEAEPVEEEVLVAEAPEADEQPAVVHIEPEQEEDEMAYVPPTPRRMKFRTEVPA